MELTTEGKRKRKKKREIRIRDLHGDGLIGEAELHGEAKLHGDGRSQWQWPRQRKKKYREGE